MVRIRYIRRAAAWSLALGCVVLFAVTKHLAASLLFAFFLLWFGVSTWKQLRDPSSHPVVRRVAAWGDPLVVARDAEREARTPHYEGSGWIVTEHYLIRSRFFTFDMLRLSDLLWAYKRITKHRFTINFIPMGKTYETYEAVLVCYGGTAVVSGLEGAVDTVLAFATGCAPWAVLGFSSELQAHFDKRNQDFCAAVEQRRRQWVQGLRSNREDLKDDIH